MKDLLKLIADRQQGYVELRWHRRVHNSLMV